MNGAVTHAIVVKVFAPLLISEEASDIERLWRRLYTKPYKLGPMVLSSKHSRVLTLLSGTFSPKPRDFPSTSSYEVSTG